MSTSDSKTLQLHNLLGDFYSRKLLVHPASPPATHDSSPEAPYAGANNSFDANVVMVLSVLLCALICSLGINSIIRCVLRCSNLVANDSQIPANSSTTPVANSGIKKKALKTFPTINYSGDLNLPGLDTECAICLSEFTSGEKVRVLPKCNHGFHVRCIDKWLSLHSSCPKCRHCLIETCNKILGSTQRHETIIPLQPEAFIRTYRGN